MIAYLNWLRYEDIVKAGIAAKEAIARAINKYMEDPENFYKTNFKWKTKSKEWEEIENRINKIIIEAEKNWEYLDIIRIQEIYNRKYKNSKILNYKQTWTVVRQRLKFNYQKPYIIDKRKPENAEDIVKERLDEAVNKVLEKEWMHEWAKSKKKAKLR